MKDDVAREHKIDILETRDELDDFIHRVPRKLRKVKESAYTPQFISIGPYHHGNLDLLPMERTKQNYFERFCERVNMDEADLKSFFRSKLSRNIEDCYEEEAIIKNKDFELGDMVARDACFIVELVLRNCNAETRRKDRILGTPWMRKSVKLDLVLLENQLPFFALRELYDHVSIPGSFEYSKSTGVCHENPRMTSSCDCFPNAASFGRSRAPSMSVKAGRDVGDRSIHPLLALCVCFFEDHFLTESGSVTADLINDVKDIRHFTDLLRQFWLPRNLMSDGKTEPENISEKKYLYCATKLDTAGVTFAPGHRERRLTDIKLVKKPVLRFVPAINCMLLKIPDLRIESDTESLLRNVMALEQCVYTGEDYVCGYVALMDQLINTGEDVDFLVEMRILTNLLGSAEEAAVLFNGLCSQIPRDRSYYARFYNDLNAFYENRWNVTRATLKKVYFKDLWTGSSTVVGLFVLLFTITATTRKVYF